MTKQSERIQKTAEEKLLKNSKQDFEFVANLLGAWNEEEKKFNKNVALELITQPETIRNLGQVTDKHNVICLYVMHAISIALGGVNCSDVLNKMSDADIKILQKSIQTAKRRSRPDTEALEKGLANSRALKHEQSSRLGIERAANQKSMALYGIVAKCWDKAVTELNRWGDAVDNFERVVPISKQWVTYEELRVALGFETIDLLYRNKCKLSKTHPEIEEWFDCHGVDGKLFNMAHFEEFKKLVNEVATGSKDVWTIVQLADKMGLKDQTDDKKREHISQIKTTVKRKYPQIVEFFTPNCRYFRAECFDEWQRLRALAGQRGHYNVTNRAEKPVKKAVAEFDPNKHYNKDQLAEVCGYKNGKILSTVVSTLKTKNDDFAKLVADCFIGVTNTKNKKYMIAFKIEKLEEFKAFLPHIVAENTKKALDSDNIISMENLAKKLGWSIATLRANLSIVLKKAKPERKAEINSWFVSSDIKKSYKSGLKIEFVDEVVKLFDGGRKYSKETTSFVRTPVKAIEKSAKVVKKAKKQKKRSVDAAEIKAELDKVLVKPGDSMVVVSEPEPVESKPMTWPDVVALDKMLTRWTKMLEAATQEHDVAERECNDIAAQLVSKNAAERVNMINQMQSANDAVLVAAGHVREIQEKIDRANALKQERQEAERVLAEKDALIAAFLAEVNVDKK